MAVKQAIKSWRQYHENNILSGWFECLLIRRAPHWRSVCLFSVTNITHHPHRQVPLVTNSWPFQKVNMSADGGIMQITSDKYINIDQLERGSPLCTFFPKFSKAHCSSEWMFTEHDWESKKATWEKDWRRNWIVMSQCLLCIHLITQLWLEVLSSHVQTFSSVK